MNDGSDSCSPLLWCVEICQYVPPVVDEFDKDISVVFGEVGWDDIAGVAITSLDLLGRTFDVWGEVVEWSSLYWYKGAVKR